MGSRKSNKKKRIAILVAAAIILGVVLFGTATNYLGALRIKPTPTTLTITDYTADPVEDQIAAQDTEDLLVARFKARATGEDWTISKLTFSPTDSTGTNAATLIDDVNSMTLSYEGASSSVTATKSGSEFIFSGMSILVPTDDFIAIELYADLDSHVLDGGELESDDALYFTLRRNGFKATGTTSGEFTAIPTVTTSNATYVYRSIPAVENATSLGTTLIAGSDMEIYRFTISADRSGSIVLGYMCFQLVTNGTELPGNLSLREHGSSEVIGWGAYNTTDQSAFMDLTMTGTTNGVTIPGGTSKTFSIYADIYEDTDNNTMTTVSTKIYNDISHVDTDVLNNIVATGEDDDGLSTGIVGIVWSDQGSQGGSHGTGISEWMNGYKVPGMPVSYVTLS